jgi:hypothetical protein
MAKETNKEIDIEDIFQPINEAPQEIKNIIERVWKLEKSRLDRKLNSHINDDILGIIKEEVQ